MNTYNLFVDKMKKMSKFFQVRKKKKNNALT